MNLTTARTICLRFKDYGRFQSWFRFSPCSSLTIFALMLLSVYGGRAQEFRATLTGKIVDPSGAPVPKTEVQASNNETKQTYRVNTTESGVFFIPYVLPGTYTLTANAPGFKKEIQENITVQGGVTRNLNLTLQLGTATQSVEVSAEPPLLETASGSGNAVLTQQEIENVPLNGRQIFTLIGTVPGSQFLQTQFGAGGYSGTRGWDVSNNYSIGGGVQGYQQFLLNGTNTSLQNNGSQGTWIFAPNIDALQEVNIMAPTYDSRYGRTGGGTVSMILKSGTNGFHGEAYEYFENGALNANNFENNLNGLPRQNLHQNQFGGIIGGPVKRNKIFFFGAYEHYLEGIPFTTLTSVPPAYLRPTNGAGVDFTQTGFTVYDPTTTRCTAPGGTIGNCPGNAYARTEFPNNTIPANRINPIGAAVLNLYPLPNSGNGVLNNFTANVPDKYNYGQPIVRVDYDLNEATRMYSMFAYQHGTEFRNTSGFSGAAENGNINTLRQTLIASQDITRVFTPTLLADFKISYTRFLSSFPDGDLSSTTTPGSIGLNMPQVPTTTLSLLPEFNNGAYYPQVVGNSVGNDTYNSFYFDNDWTKTWGSHTVHFGGEIGELQYANPGSVGHPNGVFGFGTTNTQYNPLQRNTLPGINDGFIVGDMLLGDPGSGSVDFNDTLAEGYPIFSFYAQDDWKVTRKLTINIGLRYDVQIGLRERYNRLNRGLCFTCVNPLTNDPTYQANLTADSSALSAAGLDPASLNTVYGGLLFPGVNGQSTDAYDTDWTNIQPRFGFAYGLNDKTVIRGGCGIFYAVGLEGGSNDGFSISTPYVTSTNGGVTPTNYFASGNPYPTGATTPVGSSLGLLTALGNGASVDFPGRRIPRSQQFSLGIQRALPFNMVLDASYVGNYTDRLRVFVYNNGTLTLDELQQGIANPSYLNQQVPNPYFGVPAIPASSTCGSNQTVTRVTLLLPLSQYCGSVGQYNDPLGNQNFNALEMKLNKRTSHGLNFQLAYTFSKIMAATSYQNSFPYQDTKLKYEISPYDRTHVVTLTGEWELPFGKGRMFGANTHGVVGALVGGWNVNGIFGWETGVPTALNTGFSYNCNHSYTPDGGPSLTNYIYNDYSNGSSTGCFSTLPQYALKYLPDQVGSLRNPTIPNLDLSVHKEFSIAEGSKLEFRAEANNLFNIVLFPGPDNNPSDGAPQLQSNGTYTGFGTVNLLQQNFPRVIQLALKFKF